RQTACKPYQLSKIKYGEPVVSSGFSFDPLLVHIEISLTHLAGNHDSLGANPLGHIEQFPDHFHAHVRHGDHEARPATIRLVGPVDRACAQSFDDPVYTLGILIIGGPGYFRRSARHTAV